MTSSPSHDPKKILTNLFKTSNDIIIIMEQCVIYLSQEAKFNKILQIYHSNNNHYRDNKSMIISSIKAKLKKLN